MHAVENKMTERIFNWLGNYKRRVKILGICDLNLIRLTLRWIEKRQIFDWRISFQLKLSLWHVTYVSMWTSFTTYLFDISPETQIIQEVTQGNLIGKYFDNSTIVFLKWTSNWNISGYQLFSF